MRNRDEILREITLGDAGEDRGGVGEASFGNNRLDRQGKGETRGGESTLRHHHSSRRDFGLPPEFLFRKGL